MRNSIALALAAALALSACDMIGAGRPEKGGGNESAEENGSSGNSSRNEDEGSDRSTRNEDRGSSSDQDRGGNDDRGSNDSGDDSASSSGDSRLEQELQTAVRRQQSRLPMRDGPGTITAMEAEGNRLIVTMNVEQDFGESEWDQMAAALQRNICGDNASRQMIQRGASVIYRITDSDGERQNMTTNRCD